MSQRSHHTDTGSQDGTEAAASLGLRLWEAPALETQQPRADPPSSGVVFQGDVQRTLIQVDFGDGIAVSYVNLSSMEDGIKHVYHNVGIFRVTVQVHNSLGSDSAVLYLHVTCMLLPLTYLTYCVPLKIWPKICIHIDKIQNQVSRGSSLVTC